jgi:spore germination cell wall hydrolase CwlJ-like protein
MENTRTISFYAKVVLALCVWREARGESFDVMRGVVWTILNRLKDPRWPKTLVGVVVQPKQFSSFNADDPNALKFAKDDDAAIIKCCDAVDNPGNDLTNGANHYHSIPEGRPWPSWARADKLTVVIGPMKFYKL